MTSQQYRSLTLVEMKKRKWVTARPIQTGAATIDAGQPVLVRQKRGGLVIESPRCKCCKVSFYARKCHPSDIEEVVEPG